MMTSHVLLPAIDPVLPATLSPAVIALLRDELGFDGLLVTRRAGHDGGLGRSRRAGGRRLALAAGCDLLCLGAEKDADAARRDRRGDRRCRAVGCAGRGPAGRGGGPGGAGEPPGAAVACGRLRGHAVDLRGALAARSRAAGDRQLPRTCAARSCCGSAPAPMSRSARFPWGLPADGEVLAGGTPGRRTARRHASATCSRSHPPPPLVALVREPHRHPWVPRLLRSAGGGPARSGRGRDGLARRRVPAGVTDRADVRRLTRERPCARRAARARQRSSGHRMTLAAIGAALSGVVAHASGDTALPLAR